MTGLDPTGLDHLYVQIADILAARITAGHYPASKLPSERQLAKDFGVSYITVRHSMDILRQRGLIISIHGRGTLVAPAHRQPRPAPPARSPR